MVFSSLVFLFQFLPAVLILYFLMRTPWRNAFLLIASLFFYAWGETWFLAIMILSICIDYVAGRTIAGDSIHSGKPLPTDQPRTSRQKWALVASVVANLSILAFFKYANMVVFNHNRLFSALGFEELVITQWTELILPLGISFFTFQSMSYTIDVYRGNVVATRNFWNFATYVSMFPQLVAGPIVRYRDIEKDLVERKVTVYDFQEGIRRFTIGLGKKVLIANTVALPVDMVFSVDAQNLNMTLAWIGIICYTVQIYFDFSGYSDMAIGLGRMFGFRFPENFNYPYAASSFTDFWRRWHISLSTWFRDYLYIPLGGNRLGAMRTYLNLWIVFFLCGLWHGASWTFVAWGLTQGAFLIFERWSGLDQKEGFLSGIARTIPGKACCHFYLIFFQIMAWVMIRADDAEYSYHYYQALFGFGNGTTELVTPAMLLTLDTNLALMVGLIGSFPTIPFLYRHLKKKKIIRDEGLSQIVFMILSVTALIVILLLCLVFLSASTYNPFIYYRF